MTDSLELSADKVIYQNLKVSILTVIGMSITAYLLTKYHPVKMAKINIIFFALCLLFVPYCLSHVTNLFLLSILQFITFLPALCIAGVEVSCFKHIYQLQSVLQF